MVPDHLYSSYKRYKADTDYVASWLSTTARECGYVPPSQQTASVPSVPKPPRLKGKARKLAKIVSQTSSDSQGQTYRVPIDAFVALAKSIASSHKLSKEQPTTFAYVLQCCIRERSRHLAYHLRSGTEKPSVEDDGRHDHFIGVLRQVQEVLQPLLPKPSSKDLDGVDGLTDADGVNMFENLTIEEPSELVENSARPPKIKDQESIRYSTDLGSSEREVRVATAMLFWDAHRLRGVVLGAWRLYLEGELDLMAASITTNTAVDFMRSIQLDFESTFPGRVDLTKEVCSTCLCIAHRGPSATPFHTYCMQSGHFVFDCLGEHYFDDNASSVPVVSPNSIGLFDELDPDDDSSLRWQCTVRDFKMATGVLPELCLLVRTHFSVQAEHELMRGLRLVMLEKKEVFWVTFALQLYLDMRNVLREDVVMGFAHLREEGRRIAKSIKDVLHFHRAQDIPLSLNEQAFRETVELVERYTESDYVDACRKEESGPAASAHIEAYHLLKRDPFWCGILLYNIRMVWYEGGIALANQFSSILQTAHLYNYMRETGLLQNSWSDMEYVFSAHGKNEIFIGDRPCMAMDCAKQVLLASGMSAREFARDRRRTNRLAGSTAKAKQLQMHAPVARLFKSRLCDNDGRTNFEPKDLEGVLRGVWERDRTTRTSRDICVPLIIMGEELHQEARELSFDYFSLHRICWSMLSRVVHGLADTNEDMRYIRSHPKYLADSVGILFMDVGTRASLHLPGPTEDMRRAAAIVEQTLLDEGLLAATDFADAETLPHAERTSNVLHEPGHNCVGM